MRGRLVKLDMFMEVTDYDVIKRAENHIEELLDLDAYPEIKTVYGVAVSDIREVELES